MTKERGLGPSSRLIESHTRGGKSKHVNMFANLENETKQQNPKNSWLIAHCVFWLCCT